MNGTVIGKQTVRLSWGRNPANKQVLGTTPPRPPKKKEKKKRINHSLFTAVLFLERALEDLMDNAEFAMQLALAELF